MQSIFTAASGLSSQQKRLDTLASNIANANTPGFKSTRVDFKDALYTIMENPVLANGEENNLLTGSGVILNATNIDFRQGAAVETGLPLDFAIEGNGFIPVQKANGEILYTRSASFKTTAIDNINYLVTPQGYFVLDSEGNRTTLPATGTAFSVTEKGVITTLNGNAADGENATIGLVGFANPNGLSSSGDTCYSVTEASGQPEKDESSILIQGKLENSNVDLAQELTLLIRSQRAYSLASRALKTSDEMLGLANTIH